MPKIRDFNRVTALYERLSKDDEQQGESNSILNQKRFLEDFAHKSGMTNIKHFTDDGYTGRNFNRPGFQAMLAEAEAGKIGTIIVKDMSRFGRNYFYTEILFPKKQIRKEGAHQEECLLPGLVYCADCGSKMSYQTNYYKSGEPYHSFRCSSYGNRTVNCTIHHISDKVLYQLVLRSIQRLSSHIIADERGFAEELKSKWEAQANGKPQKQKEELQTINRRLNELDRLIGSLYENFISGLLPEKQYKSLMKKYSAEQDSLESQVSEIQEKLEQTKSSSAHIGRFIRPIKKYKQKIVVHEAIGKKPNRQQQVDIYYNFIGQFDLPLSEKEIAEARRKAEQEAAEKAKRKKNRQRESNVAHQAKAKAERWAANDGHKYPKRVCEQCGKEFYPKSTRQRFCNTDCTKAHQQAEKEKKRFAEKVEHTFRQKVCKICGKPFWPSNGQEVLCSEECKAINRRQKQLAHYHRKQFGQKAGEAI